MTTFPDAVCRFDGVGLFWQGRVRPTDESREYVVKVRYRLGESPNAVIISPSLLYLVANSTKPGRKLPHVYRGDGDPLCLFFGEHEWNASMAIADTTIPWVSLWLRFFELWLITNTWEGSGAPYLQFTSGESTARERPRRAAVN